MGGDGPDLFDAAGEAARARRAPLAERLRPERLDEVVGQEHLLSAGAAFRTLVEADRLSSAVFFGPPGTGKTTVARLVATRTAAAFVQLSAVSAGVREVREVLEAARRRLGLEDRATVLFLDEIHRFSRSQQDALLHGVEDGTIVLIGATTENPFFALTAPLLSRSTLWRFAALERSALVTLARRALELEQLSPGPGAVESLVELAEGDARQLLTSVEVAMHLASSRTSSVLTVADVEAARTTRAIRHGRDEHYDLLSALIKSLRGSDPDAGLYYLARLVAAGEDPRVVARRLVILASEDVGMAEPRALPLAVAAAEALDRVGLPEAGLCLAEAVLFLATAPKSNRAAVGWWAAQSAVESTGGLPVPAALRDAHYAGAAALGHGVGYEYPHEDPSGFIARSYLPVELAGRRFYEPSEHGAEEAVKRRLAQWWAGNRASDTAGSEPTTRREGDKEPE